MAAITEILRHHPELAIFLALAAGFLIGKVKIGSFTIGPLLGTLFAGLVIGQLNIPVPSLVRVIFFDLFLFAVGYKVGPQFFRGLKKDALSQLALTVIICVTSLFTAFFISKLMNYDIGTAAGLLAGAFTESALVGTASEAVQQLTVTDAVKSHLLHNIPVTYAVTYFIGTVAVVWFLPYLAPRLLKINLRAACDKLETELSGDSKTKTGIQGAYDEWDLRAFRIESEKYTGKTVEEAEKIIPEGRMIIERIRHEGVIIDANPETVINSKDIIVVAARKKIMLNELKSIGTEIFDRELLDFSRNNADIVITKRSAAGKYLSDLAEKYGRGVMLTKLIRSGLEMPFEPKTRLNRGDLLQVSGRQHHLEEAGKALGYIVHPSYVTDIIFLATGIFLGGLVGLTSIKLFGISLTLSTSEGTLIMGLVFGWLRSRRPTIGRIPDAALWIFNTFGFTVFIGVLGIQAGPGLISGISHTGLSILIAALAVALLPHLVGLFIGYYILKMNPVILLGAQAGAGTNSTAIKALQDETFSKIPLLGYTVPYAIGNILLSAWGPAIVWLMSR